MAVEVVGYDPAWPARFEAVAARLRAALDEAGLGEQASVEHVGSTSVPGLAAKPVLDIDVIVAAPDVPRAVVALERIGYVHRGDLGVTGREAFLPPDDDPRRHVYVCEAGTLHVRNHLAVREVLRRREDLREAYAAVKRSLAEDPGMTIERYITEKSAVLQEVLADSDLTEAERELIRRLNDLTG